MLLSRLLAAPRDRCTLVAADGVRRLIPDHWLAQAELAEHGRLLRLIYGCGTIEVAGQHLETLFSRCRGWQAGNVSEGLAVSVPGDQLWVTTLLAVAPADAVPAFDRVWLQSQVRRGQNERHWSRRLFRDPCLQGTYTSDTAQHCLIAQLVNRCLNRSCQNSPLLKPR
jgi:hypothetical protein